MSEERGGQAREGRSSRVRQAAQGGGAARKAADLIRSDADDAATALEIGLVDREWLDNPGEGPISSSAPTEILRRFLERSVGALTVQAVVVRALGW